MTFSCVFVGQDNPSLLAHIRPSVPATRSTPQRAVAAESAQTAQAKAALKQVHASVHTQTPKAKFYLIYAQNRI